MGNFVFKRGISWVLTAVLLLGMIKLYSGQVVYLYRERYLEINDTENTPCLQQSNLKN